MVFEILECVYRVIKKLHQTVEEVKANKRRCKRLSDRARYLVAPLNELCKQVGFKDFSTSCHILVTSLSVIRWTEIARVQLL